MFVWGKERKGYHLNSVTKGFQTNCTPSATSIMTDGNAEDAVKSLLEVPIEKPVLLSDAALTNLYNISHNVQESYSKSSCL